MDIEKKRVVILGGSSGIGLATAKLAGQAGAELVIVSSRKASVNRALEGIAGRHARPCGGPQR